MKFLTDDRIIDTWLELIKYFQAMNLNKRQLYEHVQYENPTYFTSFATEIEFCSTILWSFLQHLASEEELCISIKVINKLLILLDRWHDSVNTKNGIKPNPKHLTFHIPLHRYYSLFIYNAIHRQNCDPQRLFISNQLNLGKT